MARVVALTSDLLLGSKVEAMLSASGHEVTMSASLPDISVENVDLVVADLDGADPEALAGLGVPVLGYYSHVNVDTRQSAEAAGVDLVVPRSRMVRELPQLADQLLKR